MIDHPELTVGMVDEGDTGALGWGDVPAPAQKVDLVVGVDAPLYLECQMEVQERGGRAGPQDRALLRQGFFPGVIGAAARRAADGGVLAFHLPIEHALGGGIVADFFIGQEGHQPLLEGAEAAFNLAFGLWAGSHQVGHAQRGEGALELRARIAVIGHGIMAKEAQAVGIDNQRDQVLEKEAAKVLEVIPSGVGRDEDRPQEFARMVIHREQQGLLVLCRPPLVDGGIMLPEFPEARPFPAAPGLGVWRGLADEMGQVGSGKGGDGLAVAVEIEAGGQLIRHELEVGRSLQGEELLEKLDGLGRPVWPVVAARELGGESGAILEEAGAEPVQVSATDLEVVGGVRDVNDPFIKLLEDELEKRVGEALGELRFLIAPSQSHRGRLGEGFRRPSLRSGLLKPSPK